MKVSIVLTVLNEAGSIGELVEALLAQSAPFDEIVVVDGGSRDATVERLAALARRDARIRVHVEPGVNIARGRNLAIERACGEVIAVTDGGCRPERDWLRELLRPFEEDPGVGAVGGRFVAETEGRFEHYCGLFSVPDLGHESQRGMFYGRSSAFRRALWQRAGGYPEWLYTGEDTLFALRAGRLGTWRIAYAPASVVRWRPRPTLRKMARMFYLYGRGNGRIGHGELGATMYWLRYYAAFVAGLALALVSPWFLALSALAGWQLYRLVVAPALHLAAQADGAQARADRFLHVPLIVLARNLSTNLGFVRGWLEYRGKGDFKRRHEAYLDGLGG